MDDPRIGLIFRGLRRRHRLLQRDVARRAGVSQPTISRLERGHLDQLTFETVRRVARVLEIRLDIVPRWRGGNLDRLVNERHSRLHESVARHLRTLPGWVFEPEVSFSIWGERGVVDILAWHSKRRILLVIELKTALVDVNELVGTFDRKLRLAVEIARRHGWAIPDDATVAGWVVVADTRTNRRHVAAHGAMLRAAYPADGRTIRGWMARPRGSIRCLSIWHGTGN